MSLLKLLFFIISITGFTQNNLNYNIFSGKNFKIVLDWAYPTSTMDLQKLANAGLFRNGSSPSQISLTGAGNYIEFKNDSIKGHLSYFGVQQMLTNYGNIDGGINFKGIPKKLKVTKDKRNNYKLQFKINDSQNPIESYNISLRINAKKVNAYLSSNARSSINYTGKIVPE